MWFRPIETRIGPDGALYICDFYNQAVVHNDTRGTQHSPANAAIRPDRDHYFGRIWRVDHKQRKLLDVPNLAAATPAQLLKALEHPNVHVRKTAQRLITEQGSAMPAEQFVKTFSPAAASVDESNVRWNIHWQWILANLNVQPRVEPAAPVRENPELRKNSLRVLTAMVEQKASGNAAVAETSNSAEKSDELLRDTKQTNARVSLDAILALRPYASDKRASAALVAIYPDLNDPWRESALIGVALEAPDGFLAEALAVQSPERMKDFVVTVYGQVTNEAHAAAIIGVLADGPASADSLKLAALQTFARGLNAGNAPVWT